MSNRFTQKAQNTLNNSLRFAAEMGHTYIGSEHILLALLAEADSIASKLLTAKGLTVQQLKEEIATLSGLGSPSTVSPADMTPRTKRIIEGSAMESARHGQSYIGTEHLLLSLLNEKDSVGVQILEHLGISANELRREAEGLLGSGATQGGETQQKAGTRGSNSAALAKAPTLASFGRDLTALAKAGKIDPIIGRDAETDRKSVV